MIKIPPPLWALIFLAAAAGLSALLGWPRFPDSRIVALGIVLVIAGLALPVWGATLFLREGTELNPTSATNAKLVTGGPFGFTRNPMYLGLTVITLGVAFWTGWTPMFAVPVLMFATANWVHIPFEEAKMRKQYGAAFDAYAARVRRWI